MMSWELFIVKEVLSPLGYLSIPLRLGEKKKKARRNLKGYDKRSVHFYNDPLGAAAPPVHRPLFPAPTLPR